MRILPTSLTILTAVVLLTAATATLGDGVPAAVHYFDHDKVAATFVKGGNLVTDPGLVVAAGRRGTGQVEYHDHTSHIFIIVDGEVTLLVGGNMVDAKRTAPDQMRAADVEGATTYHLAKGDVITVPAKTPHWFKEIPTTTVAYYAVNIETQ
jgi:mannose-6-phosphate isomerase-like protein (cupin superfamily)